MVNITRAWVLCRCITSVEIKRNDEILVSDASVAVDVSYTSPFLLLWIFDAFILQIIHYTSSLILLLSTS